MCLCGDGRNDFLGYSVRYCVYTLMEYVSKVVVDMVVVDKREIGGNFVVMEKEGLRWFLEKMVSVFFFSEFVIDVFLLIMKFVCDMKGMFMLFVYFNFEYFISEVLNFFIFIVWDGCF